MVRVFLTIIVPLLLPTALFAFWRALPGRRALPPGGLPGPWLWLLIAGFGLAAVTLIVLNVDFGAPRAGVYVPPHLSDGQVVPGHIAPETQH